MTDSPEPTCPVRRPQRLRPSYRTRPRSRVSRRSGPRSGRPTTPTPSTAPRPAPRSTRSTRPRRPCPARCTSGTSSPTPTPTWSRASSGCGASRCSTRWAGTTTACPTERRVQNYFGVRCDPSLPYDAALHPARQARPQATDPDQPAQLRRALRAARRGGRAGLRGAVAHPRAVGGLEAALHDHRTEGRRRSASARSCATSPAARPTCRRRRPCGTSPSRRRSPRPSSRPGSTPATTTGSPSTAPTDPVAIETTRPELIPSVVALIAHPDDERYQPLFGTTVTSPVFGVEIPVLAHPAAEPDKGAGIAMCCTFGDLTDVTWWRELQLPVRTLIGRDGRMSRETPEWLAAAPAACGVRGPQGQDRVQCPRGDGRQAARERRPRG